MKKSVVGLIALFSVSANAQLVGSESKNWLFVSGQFGVLSTSTELAGETDKSGAEGAVMLVGAHYFDRAVIDLGAGYAFSTVSGQNPAGTKVQVITRSLIAELSPRYRIDQSWQIGPVFQVLFGGDVSYDESPIDELSNQWRYGGRIQYELGTERRWRLGLQMLTDFNIDRRKATVFGATIQYGFPTDRTPAYIPTSTTTVVYRPEFVEAKDRTIRIYLGEAMLSFKSGDSKLNSKAKEALAKLAPVLARNVSAWEKLRIEGHTDARIGKKDNQLLSEKRAEVVKKELVSLKLPESKISSKGFGATKPIDTAADDQAYLLNRRVEIWLDEVNPDEIPKIMTELKQLQ